MIFANAALMIAFPNRPSEIFACLNSLNAELSDFSPSGGYSTNDKCLVNFQQPSDQAVASSTTSLPDQLLSLVFKIPGISFLAQLLPLIAITIYMLVNIYFIGWLNIYNILFLNNPSAVPVFFFIGIGITMIQLIFALLVKVNILMNNGRHCVLW
jgi:hypothetical protein